MINPQLEVEELARLRGTFYHLLSKCFFQADEELVSSLLNGSLVQMFKMTLGNLDDEKVTHAIEIVERYTKKCNGNSLSDVIREMNIEYNRLFVGPGHLPSPPYESVYLTIDEDNKDGIVLGDSALDAKYQYLSAGISLPEDFTDLPDHIGVELDFMSYLCFEESSKIQEGDDEGLCDVVNKQYDFITNHLDNWISSFTDAVVNSTELDFYKGLVQITEFWIRNDQKSFLDDIEETQLILN